MRYCEPTKKQVNAWTKWKRKLPPLARAAAERFNPWTLYRLKGSGDRVTVHAFADDGKVTIIVSGRWNKVLFEREVFGIHPDDLEECDLPGPNEEVGSIMTVEEAKANLDIIKVAVRPDLWMLGEDGKAVRKQ